MRSCLLTACGPLLLVSIASAALASEKVDNPQFAAWVKYGVGSGETLEASMDIGAVKTTQITTRKLTEKADDHLTIEIAVTTSIMGHDHKIPAMSVVIQAKCDPKDATPVANEKVEAAGKKFDCNVFEVTPESIKAKGTGKVKIWVTTDVPGGLVKMETVTAHGSITSLLKSFETK